ncbi:MAG TPA: DUF2460 domain-containing protein [Burkholderiaceae bacterium]|nr:DUF2460 domain-containing protein [Burkholderiaceae bacterium]
MSNAILPSFPGLSWGRRRAVRWNTTVKRAASGREYRAANWSAPVYEYQLDYELLRQQPSLPEMEQLLGFVNLRRGSFDSFLYLDPHDHSAEAQGFGSGDGSRTLWQLVRSFGGFAEPVLGIVEAPQVFMNGALQPGAVVSPEGLVSFPQAPPAGSALTWSGTFYWRCRFLKDGAEFSEFLSRWHELRGLSFTTIKA